MFHSVQYRLRPAHSGHKQQVGPKVLVLNAGKKMLDLQLSVGYKYQHSTAIPDTHMNYLQ